MAAQRPLQCLGDRVPGRGMRMRYKGNILCVEKIASIGHRIQDGQGALVFQ